MMWKSTSSNGWEYLIMLKGLVFKFCLCQIVCYFSDMFYRGAWYYIPRGVGIITKHVLIELVVHWIDIAMDVCSNLDECEMNSCFFSILFFFMDGKGQEP